MKKFLTKNNINITIGLRFIFEGYGIVLHIFLLFYEFDRFMSLIYKSNREFCPQKVEIIKRVKNSLENRLFLTLFLLYRNYKIHFLLKKNFISNYSIKIDWGK